jgi:membrane peptidoglycan carboxypeptidase
VKTGTTNDYKDAWTIGYTPSIAIGVWAGNNDASPMVKEIAGYIVAPMWHAVMEKALAKYPQEYFGEGRPMPENAKPVLFGNYSEGGAHEILHTVDRNDPLGPSPSNPANDPQYAYWEYPVQIWSTIRTDLIGGQ